ncbi:MAG: hypothetical protein AAF250_01780 [Pseudomonadota bacterium]
MLGMKVGFPAATSAATLLAMADTATVWWIERDTGELCSQSFGTHDIAGSGTFENEVVIKYASDPIEMTTIYHSRAGNAWEQAAMERLRNLSAGMRQSLPAADE